MSRKEKETDVLLRNIASLRSRTPFCKHKPLCGSNSNHHFQYETAFVCNVRALVRPSWHTLTSFEFVYLFNFPGKFLATNFMKLATIFQSLGAKWHLEKKVNFVPWMVCWRFNILYPKLKSGILWILETKGVIFRYCNYVPRYPKRFSGGYLNVGDYIKVKSSD